MLPFISAFTCTYGRPIHMVNDVIECFLRQYYGGKKELVILNDLKNQQLIFDHPDVRIINTNERILPLGSKFNAAVNECNGDIVMPWEDDDIFLPWRMSVSIDNMVDGWFHTGDAWWLYKYDKMKIVNNLFHSALAIEKNDLVYRDTESCGLDQLLWEDLGSPKSMTIEHADIFYIYRTHHDSYHASGYDRNTNASENAARYVQKRMNYGKIRLGKVNLKPSWSRNWIEFVKAQGVI